MQSYTRFRRPGCSDSCMSIKSQCSTLSQLLRSHRVYLLEILHACWSKGSATKCFARKVTLAWMRLRFLASRIACSSGGCNACSDICHAIISVPCQLLTVVGLMVGTLLTSPGGLSFVRRGSHPWVSDTLMCSNSHSDRSKNQQHCCFVCVSAGRSYGIAIAIHTCRPSKCTPYISNSKRMQL